MITLLQLKYMRKYDLNFCCFVFQKKFQSNFKRNFKKNILLNIKAYTFLFEI
jgi:hypothetical protein